MTITVLNNALIDIFGSALGEDGTYNPAGGTPVSCRLIVNRNVLMQPDGMTAMIYEKGTTIEAMLSVIGQEPNRGDTFTVGATTYTVQSIEQNDGYTVTAVVT
jgi:hypothetical protein